MLKNTIILENTKYQMIDKEWFILAIPKGIKCHTNKDIIRTNLGAKLKINLLLDTGR